MGKPRYSEMNKYTTDSRRMLEIEGVLVLCCQVCEKYVTSKDNIEIAFFYRMKIESLFWAWRFFSLPPMMVLSGSQRRDHNLIFDFIFCCGFKPTWWPVYDRGSTRHFWNIDLLKPLLTVLYVLLVVFFFIWVPYWVSYILMTSTSFFLCFSIVRSNSSKSAWWFRSSRITN